MAEYSGSIELISGIKPKNNGKFPLVNAKDVQVDASGKRLDEKLTELGNTALHYSYEQNVISEDGFVYLDRATCSSDDIAQGEFIIYSGGLCRQYEITETGYKCQVLVEFASGGGESGGSGEDGRGIVSILRTNGNGAPGTTDTYTITYTDNTTSTFTVYNGKDGTSVTITDITESTEDGGSNVVTFSDGKTLTVKNGNRGADGNGSETTFEDITLVENAYDASTAKFNVRLAGNTGTEVSQNGSLALDYTKVKYDPEVYVLISGIEKLILNYDMYFSVNYYDANKTHVGTKIMAHTQFGTYDGTLPCSFPIFRPTANSESEIVGIENTEYIRIKLGITSKATAISATDCEGLSVKIATKANISKKSSAIPLHWETAVAEKTETIKTLQTNGGKNCVSFAWASDTHIPNNAAGRTDYIGKVMARMLDNCEAPFAVITGDAVTRGSMPTEEEYLAEQAQVPLHLAPLWGTDRLLVALGNHDGCWGDSTGYYRHQLTPERMWHTFFRGQALDFRRVFSDDGLYYYVDNIAQKTRFIVLNSQFGGEYSENANGHAVNNRFGTSCYGQAQLDWFADVALDMPSGYGAIIFTHVPPRAVNGATTPYTVDYAQFNGIINAYCNKTTYSGSFSGVAGWTSNNVSVDFSNAQGEIIALFAGHIHEDTIDTETLECPIITVTAGGAPSNNDEQIYNRPYGTGLETSFDVVTINRATKMIYCTRVGAGSDRAVSYAKTAPATYTVTWVVDGNTTTETYNEGETPSFKGSTNKSATAQYTYTFKGWDKTIVPVSGDVTYTAQYTETLNKYTITWNVDGTITTSQVEYGKTPTFTGSTDKASDGQYNYTFTGWSPAISPVTGNVTYTAQYSQTAIVPDVKTYTITNTLTNCSNSNSATTITEGSAYNATITANDGYTLDSVAVTMGGVDITHTFDDLGTINIGTVTGNIVITAVASQTPTEPSYTNLAQPNDTNTTWSNDWVNNARMGSDGSHRPTTNSMVTNRIQFAQGDTIYFANIGNFTSAGNGITTGDNICILQTVDGTVGRLNGGTPATLVSAMGESVVKFTEYDDGTLKSMKFLKGLTNPPVYFRLCLDNTIDKSKIIITKNEPIE